MILRIAVTVVAAASLSLLAAPTNLHWLHWVALVPMFWVLRAETPRANFWLGWLYGLVGVALLFRWLVDTIVVFSNLGIVLAVGVLLLFGAAFGSPYAILWSAVHRLRRRLGPGWILALPALQVVLEYASMYVLLFPYNHGVSQYRFPLTWQLASVTGVWGVTALLFFVNSVLGEWIYRAREGGPAPVGWLCSAVWTVSLVIAFGAWRFERVEAILREAPTVRIAQLQSSLDMEYRMSHSTAQAFRDWVNATEALPAGSVDLVVWPEGACPYDLNVGKAVQILSEVAAAGDFEMVIGGGSRERVPDPDMGEAKVRLYNSVYFFERTGEVTGRYDKMVPLPFGEYFPFGDWVPWLRDSIEGIGGFRAGKEPVVWQGEHGGLAAPICYEAILPSVIRRFGAADLIVNVTNDAWFGDTAAPSQHAMLAAVRSVELGIGMYRSAYTGISMVVEPHGNIHSETEPFVDLSRAVTVRRATVPTLYRRFGDWFVAVCGIGLFLALLAAPWLPSRRLEQDGEQPP